MAYVDGFVFAVAKDKLEEYKKMALEGAAMWKKYGALDYKECMGDDMNPNMGSDMLTFPALLNLKEDEVAFFSYIVYKSRAHRDEVNAAVMSDPEMSAEKYKDKVMPFDMKRMAVGGFEVVVEM